jgi:AraC-like DNA-binding protein
LVGRLLPIHGVRELSRLLDIPKSVIYRWRATKRARESVAGSGPDAGAIAALIARCDDLGFAFAERMLGANATAAPAPLKEAGLAAGNPARANGRVASEASRDGAGESVFTVASAPAAGVPGSYGGASVSARVFDRRRERPSRGVRRRLEAVRRLIDAHYFLDIDSRMLAETARMSRHHFIRSFSGCFGISPHQYLTRARIAAAKRLLLSSREPIEVIAVGVGFQSGPSLNRAFKQIEGASASKYCQQTNRDTHESRERTWVAAAASASQPLQDN